MGAPTKRLRLQGKCQLAEMPAAGVSWETDDNGFIISARGKETTATYRYDSDGYPLGKPPPPKRSDLPSPQRRQSDPRKKLDYTAISTFNDRTLGTVRQTCDYDDHDNPLSCELQVVDESVQPPLTRHYTIKTVSIITEPSASAGTARAFCARPDTGAGTGTCGWCCGTRR